MRRLTLAIAVFVALALTAATPAFAIGTDPAFRDEPNTFCCQNTFLGSSLDNGGLMLRTYDDGGFGPVAPPILFDNEGTSASEASIGIASPSSSALRITDTASQPVTVRSGDSVGNATELAVNPSSLSVGPQGGTAWYAVSSGGFTPTVPILANGQYVQYSTRSAPPAPAAGKVRVFAGTNANNKTALYAEFATGSPVQIAAQP